MMLLFSFLLMLYFMFDLLELHGFFVIAFALVFSDIDGHIHLFFLKVVPWSFLGELDLRLSRLLAFNQYLFDAFSTKDTASPRVPALLFEVKDTLVSLIAFPVIALA